MEICELEIKPEALARIPEEIKACIFHLSRAVDEISLLQKCFGLTVSETCPNESLTIIQQNSAFSLVFLLAGKIYEAWNLLQEAMIKNQGMREFQRHLSSETKKAFDQIKKYFSKSNIIERIRNKASFHYDHDLFKQELAMCKYPEMNRFFLAEQSGNCHFYIGSFVATSTIMNLTPGENTIEKIKYITQEIGKTANWFSSLTHELFLQVFADEDFVKKNIWVDDQQLRGGRIPCFLPAPID